MAEPDFPDVPSDSISVASGPYGLALSFLLTDPLESPPIDAKLPGRVVARVRISPLLAQALVTILQRSLKNMPDARLAYEDQESPNGSAGAQP